MASAEFPIKNAVTQTVIKVNDRDLDRFISEHYGISFEGVPDQEWRNDMYQCFTVKKEDIEVYETSKLEKWKNGEHVDFMLDTLLTDLCNRDILPECELLIHVFW